MNLVRKIDMVEIFALILAAATIAWMVYIAKEETLGSGDNQ